MGVKVVRALAVSGVALLGSVALAGAPAEASGGPPQGTATVAAASSRNAPADCEVTPAAGQGTINVRSSPSTSAGIADYLQPGEFMESYCYSEAGGSYSACGGSSDRWIAVHIGLFWYGYVARRCVTLYQWAE